MTAKKEFINLMSGNNPTTIQSLFSSPSLSKNQPLSALVFVKHTEGNKITVGMSAYLLPSGFSFYDYGYIKAQVIHVSSYPITKEIAYFYLENMNLVDEFFMQGAPFMVEIRLEQDHTSTSGLAWTTRGPAFRINPGTMVTAKIIYKTCSPWQLMTKHEGTL
jgi:hypothetical protein